MGTGVAGLCGRRVSSSHLFTTSDISDVHMCGVSLCTNVRNRVSLFADAYAALVTDCFAESSTFHKALKEAFEGFCNDRVGDAAVAELVANHCDALLKRGGVEKLSDDATDEALDKVVRLLAYIAEK